MSTGLRSTLLWVGLIGLMVWGPARASAGESEKSAVGPHHKGPLSSLNLGARFSSVLQNRGIIFYRDFQLDPILAIFLLDDRVEFLGDSIGFRDFIAGDWLRFRTRFVSITDKPLFPAHDSIKDSSPDRNDTYEWENSLEFFFGGYGKHYRSELDLRYAKGIGYAHGHYFESQAKYKLTDFRLPGAGVKIEPNVFGLVGVGDLEHNLYFYGPGAVAGFNNLAYGLWFAFPEEADRYYPIIQIRRFETIGGAKSGSYSFGRGEGFLVSFIATYGILE